MSLPSLAFALVSLGGGIITGALTGPLIFAPCWDPASSDSGACAQRLRTFRSVFSLESTVYAAVNAFQSAVNTLFTAIVRPFRPTVRPSDTACLDGAVVNDPQCMIPLLAIDPALPHTVSPGNDTKPKGDKDKVYWYNRPLFDTRTSISHESPEDITLGDYGILMAACVVLFAIALSFRRYLLRSFRTTRTARRSRPGGIITEPLVDVFPPSSVPSLSPIVMQALFAASTAGEDDEFESTGGSDTGYDSDNVLIDMSNLPFYGLSTPTIPTSPAVPSKTPRRDAAKAALTDSMRTMPWADYGLPPPDFEQEDRFGRPLKVERSTRGKSPMMAASPKTTSPLDLAPGPERNDRSHPSEPVSENVNKDKVTTALDKGKPVMKGLDASAAVFQPGTKHVHLNASAAAFQPGTKYVQVKGPSDMEVGGNGYTGEMGTGGEHARDAGKPVVEFSESPSVGVENPGVTPAGGDRARNAGQPVAFSQPRSVGVENAAQQRVVIAGEMRVSPLLSSPSPRHNVGADKENIGVMPTGGDRARDAGQPIHHSKTKVRQDTQVDVIALQLSAFKIHVEDAGSSSFAPPSPTSSGSLIPPSAEVTTPDYRGTTPLVDTAVAKASAANFITSDHSDAPQDLPNPPEHGSTIPLNAMNQKAEIHPLAAVESEHACPPACLDSTAATANSSTVSSSESVSTMSADVRSTGRGRANEDVEMASRESHDGACTPTGIASSTTKHSIKSGETPSDVRAASPSRSLTPTPTKPAPQHNPAPETSDTRDFQSSSGYYMSPTMTPATV